MAGAGCWATTAARSGTRRRSRGRRTASQPSSAAKFIELVRRTHPALSTGRDHDLLTFGGVLQRPYGAGKTGREPDGRGLAELIRTTTAPEKARLPWLKLARFGNAGVEAIVYTSPSHTDAAPRWRILCVFSCELSPDRRQHMLGRFNGLFRGVLAEE